MSLSPQTTGLLSCTAVRLSRPSATRTLAGRFIRQASSPLPLPKVDLSSTCHLAGSRVAPEKLSDQLSRQPGRDRYQTAVPMAASSNAPTNTSEMVRRRLG